MLEGLEISEVKFSYVKLNDVFRVDSNYFQKIFLQQEKNILKNKSTQLIELGCDLKSFGAYSLNNQVEYMDEGIPFVRGINLKGGRIKFNDIIYISLEAHKLLWKSEVHPKTILLSMSGTIGDVAIASEYLKYPINSNQDIAKISCSDELNPYYLYAFLCSYFGQNYLKREARGSVQQHVFLSQIERFQIPEFTFTFYDSIERVIKKSDLVEEQSQEAFKKAEVLLLDTLGMVDFLPDTETVNIKSFKDSFAVTGRLDAEYYQPKYEDFERRVKNHAQGFTTINDEYELVKATSRRDKAAYNYIEIGDVNVSDGAASFNKIEVGDLPDNAKQEVQRGDLLISKVRPNRGAVAIIEFDDTDLIVSGAFTVLREKADSEFSNETLKVLLRTKIYREWLLKFNVGTQYPVIRDEDILGLPIPKVERAVQTKIAELVQDSAKLKAESERLLAVAKRAVEMAIEQDEAAAITYIAHNVTSQVQGN